MIKNGTRLQSQVCDTQVIVVRTADSLDVGARLRNNAKLRIAGQ